MKKLNYQEALKLHTTMILDFKGVSMRPMLRQNRDKIVIEEIESYLTHATLKKYDVVMFLREITDHGAIYVLHRILKINEDGTYWIVGDNCVSGDIVTRDQIVGVLTEYMRGTKVCKPCGLLYELYVNLWCRPYLLRFVLLRGRHMLGRIYHKLFRR